MTASDSSRQRAARNSGSERAEHLAGLIMSLARREGMKAGDRLIEQRLADALDLSRAPIRLGLKALEAAGLARGEPHRGFVLAKNPTSGAARPALAAVRRSEQVYATIAGDVLASRLPADVTEAELMRRYDLSRAELQRLLDRIAAEAGSLAYPAMAGALRRAYRAPPRRRRPRHSAW
ncbi:GntR family transcriptional regulator [Bradyrhizobium sp. SSUT77]|uniref:GntR family transcriptional regulator n=1 Tax=Bradyrhizobium sp. SSUT77 TaxID=3040603 RepID=UPI00244A926C|nr:GntR family transcriptional regulator [Bradyrhizobium sp. SSUT77]MDH2346165.1 GntR family transcriptional regulator [Bradyrhizobium sp. SSUT77]